MLNLPNIDPQAIIDTASHVNWLQPTWDLFIILFFVVASLIYGISLGRDRIIVILVSIYMSLAIVNYIPFITAGFNANISVDNSFALRISVFLGMFILLFFFLSHSAIMRTLGHRGMQGKLWQVMIFSFLHVGLLVSVTLSFFPRDITYVLSSMTQLLFISNTAKAVWVLLPVVAMAVFGAGESERNYS